MPEYHTPPLEQRTLAVGDGRCGIWVEHADEVERAEAVGEVETVTDDELVLEARVNDLIREIQNLRKESGLEIVDRIRLWIPEAELLPFADRIAEATLAVAIEVGAELKLEKA